MYKKFVSSFLTFSRKLHSEIIPLGSKIILILFSSWSPSIISQMSILVNKHRKEFENGKVSCFRGVFGERRSVSHETMAMANKEPRSLPLHYVLSPTHKKTRLRNSNDIMFAPVSSIRQDEPCSLSLYVRG